MAKNQPSIKTIINTNGNYYAAYLPSPEDEIEQKIVPIVCWALMEFHDSSPDEVVGQIIVKDTIMETTGVDEEEGFGELLGYFQSEQDATAALMEEIAVRKEEESEGIDTNSDDEDEDEDEDDEDEDEDEDDED